MPITERERKRGQREKRQSVHPFISFHSDFPGQLVAAVVPSGCVGLLLQPVRQGVAVHPAGAHFRDHCRTCIRLVTSYGYRTCPYRAAEAVGGAADPSDGRMAPSIAQGTSRSPVGVVAEVMLASRAKSEGEEPVVFGVIGDWLEKAGFDRQQKGWKEAEEEWSNWESEEMSRCEDRQHWRVGGRQRWKKLFGDAYRRPRRVLHGRHRHCRHHLRLP